MNDMTEMPAPLLFTDSAVEKVRSLIEEEGNPELKLRVFVTGGGCSGFQYGFTFDEVTNDDDTSLVKGRRDAADRPDELPVPCRRRDRLPGRPRRRAVRDQESERDHHLRLRVVVLRLTPQHSMDDGARAAPFVFLVGVAPALSRRQNRVGVAMGTIAPGFASPNAGLRTALRGAADGHRG